MKADNFLPSSVRSGKSFHLLQYTLSVSLPVICSTIFCPFNDCNDELKTDISKSQLAKEPKLRPCCNKRSELRLMNP